MPDALVKFHLAILLLIAEAHALIVFAIFKKYSEIEGSTVSISEQAHRRGKTCNHIPRSPQN